MSGTAWELLFMMLILKLPIVYLCYVVYWAIKSEPTPPEPALLPVVPEDPNRPPSLTARRPPRRPQRGGPHTSPRKRARAAASR
jgi:hypothetical protein